MPYKSKSQMRWMHANKPEIAKKWDKKYGTPDGTGPYGRGMGPGKGKADGTGLEKKAKKKALGTIIMISFKKKKDK